MYRYESAKGVLFEKKKKDAARSALCSLRHVLQKLLLAADELDTSF